jgi:hypothetical protein
VRTTHRVLLNGLFMRYGIIAALVLAAAGGMLTLLIVLQPG